MDEVIDGEDRARIVAGEQVAHIAGNARQSLEARRAVEKVRDLPRAHALLVDQVENDTGIHLAWCPSAGRREP
jgi:hypothetical protein